MPNGKGSLECCYCIHWDGKYQGYDGAYEEGTCKYFAALLPSTVNSWSHRICADFKPNASFEKESRISYEERFSWFGIKLEPGVLYIFSYNQPADVKEFIHLDKQKDRS
ncbi:MAG: hypothetical protein AB1489_37445 [Acidobacteriota bacterium]